VLGSAMATFIGNVDFECPACHAKVEQKIEIVAATRQNAFAEAVSGAVCSACGSRPALCVTIHVEFVESDPNSLKTADSPR